MIAVATKNYFLNETNLLTCIDAVDSDSFVTKNRVAIGQYYINRIFKCHNICTTILFIAQLRPNYVSGPPTWSFL